MSWDNEKTLSFIKEYERRPILWRKNDKLYYNIVKKEDAWREIASIFEEDIAVLKKKIESLRGSRRREKTRMLTSMRTGTGRKDVYVSKWFAWDSLKFLEDPEELRNTISNYPEEHTAAEESTEDAEHSDHSQVLENEHTAESTEDDVQRNSDNSTKDDQVEINIALSKKIINPKEKKFISPKRVVTKRKNSEDPRIQEAFNILQKTVKSSYNENDESSLFAKYIAEKLRQFDKRTRTMLQHEIHSIFFRAEMNMHPVSMPQQMLSQLHSQPTPLQIPINKSAVFATQPEELTPLQNATPSSYYVSSRCDSALSNSTYYVTSSPSTSYTASPLPSPQDHPESRQPADNSGFSVLAEYLTFPKDDNV